jgi:predicted MFS family arabinose efflux permease
VGVGVGEAGGVAPAYSLVSDYFPPGQRARALGAYSFGVPIGSALGLAAGGVLASYVDWRAAFIVVGLAGVCIAPLLPATVREARRGQFDAAPESAAAGFRHDVSRLMRKPSFWSLSVGASCASIMGYGLFFWLPSFFERSHGLTLMQASLGLASMTLFAGTIGIWFGSSLADRLGKRSRGAYAWVPASAFIVSLPFLIAGALATSAVLAFGAFAILYALSIVWLGPVISAIQHLVAPSLRATASAIFLFVNNLIGLGAGTLILGAISDRLAERFGGESLRYAILCGAVFYVASAAILVLASRRLAADWHDQDGLRPSAFSLQPDERRA